MIEGGFATLKDADLAWDIETFAECVVEVRRADLSGVKPWHVTVYGPWDSAGEATADVGEATRGPGHDPTVLLGEFVGSKQRAFFLMRVATPRAAAAPAIGV